MANEFQEMLAVMWEAADTMPAAKRIKIYRGMAAICGDEEEQKKLLNLAEALELAESLCLELKFSFVQDNKDCNGDGDGNGKGGDGK